jgi:hypothetical protein
MTSLRVIPHMRSSSIDTTPWFIAASRATLTSGRVSSLFPWGELSRLSAGMAPMVARIV